MRRPCASKLPLLASHFQPCGQPHLLQRSNYLRLYALALRYAQLSLLNTTLVLDLRAGFGEQVGLVLLA